MSDRISPESFVAALDRMAPRCDIHPDGCPLVRYWRCTPGWEPGTFYAAPFAAAGIQFEEAPPTLAGDVTFEIGFVHADGWHDVCCHEFPFPTRGTMAWCRS